MKDNEHSLFEFIKTTSYKKDELWMQEDREFFLANSSRIYRLRTTYKNELESLIESVDADFSKYNGFFAYTIVTKFNSDIRMRQLHFSKSLLVDLGDGYIQTILEGENSSL